MRRLLCLLLFFSSLVKGEQSPWEQLLQLTDRFDLYAECQSLPVVVRLDEEAAPGLA